MEILKQIEKMDKASDEFFEVYKAVDDKYWTFDEPDEDQKYRQLLRLLINGGEAWHVELCVRLMSELFNMVEKKMPASHGSFGIKDKEYHFDFYTDKNALANLEKMLRQTITVQGQKQ